MLNKFIWYLLLTNFFLNIIIHAEEKNHRNEGNFKYNLSICAIFKNEAKFLKEWIDHHCNFGVDHFYLYNIGSKDSFQDILKPYIEEGIVTLIHWPEAVRYQEIDAERWALSTQLPAYENAVNFIARGETKWLVFVDIDEFLVCSEEPIKELLKKYDDYAGIYLSSDFFDAAISEQLSQEKLLIHPFAATSPPKQTVENAVAKMVFKPDLCTGFVWPPYQCCFQPFQSSSTEVGRQELRINRYLNRNKKKLSIGKKSKCNQGIDHHKLSEAQSVALIKESNLSDRQEPPNHQHIQNILKKMGQKIEVCDR